MINVGRVIAILGGLGAALCWAAGTLCAAKASRLIGARSVLAWVMLVGLAITAPVAVVSGIPRGPSSDRVAVDRPRGGRQRGRVAARVRGDAPREGVDRRADQLHRGCDRCAARGCDRRGARRLVRDPARTDRRRGRAREPHVGRRCRRRSAHDRSLVARRRRGLLFWCRPLRDRAGIERAAARVGCDSAAYRGRRRCRSSAARRPAQSGSRQRQYPSSSPPACARSQASRPIPSARVTASPSVQSSRRSSPPSQLLPRSCCSVSGCAPRRFSGSR